VAARFTFGPRDAVQPIWSPDGKQIVFSCERNGYFSLCLKPSSGVQEQALLSEAADDTPTSWSRDGRYIAYSRLAIPGNTRSDVWILPLFGDRKPFPFLASPAEENDATFSPDGKWMAYMSYESGRNEIYVTSFPTRSSKWQVSTSGGREPRWRADGKELFYFSSDNVLTAVEVKTSTSGLELGVARPLFTIQLRAFRGAFDVSADGRHFLVNAIANENLPPLMLVTNWDAELKKK
jgi:Tol biopolymer transport system component